MAAPRRKTPAVPDLAPGEARPAADFQLEYRTHKGVTLTLDLLSIFDMDEMLEAIPDEPKARDMLAILQSVPGWDSTAASPIDIPKAFTAFSLAAQESVGADSLGESDAGSDTSGSTEQL